MIITNLKYYLFEPYMLFLPSRRIGEPEHRYYYLKRPPQFVIDGCNFIFEEDIELHFGGYANQSFMLGKSIFMIFMGLNVSRLHEEDLSFNNGCVLMLHKSAQKTKELIGLHLYLNELIKDGFDKL